MTQSRLLIQSLESQVILMYIVFYAGRSECLGLQVQLNDPLVFLEGAVVHTAVVGTCCAFIDACNEIN